MKKLILIPAIALGLVVSVNAQDTNKVEEKAKTEAALDSQVQEEIKAEVAKQEQEKREQAAREEDAKKAAAKKEENATVKEDKE